MVTAGAVALSLSSGTAYAVMTVFDPQAYQQIVTLYNTAREQLKFAQDTYNQTAGIYSEVSGYINFASNIINSPEKFITNTVQCLFTLNFGPIRPTNVNLCQVAKEIVAELTLSPDPNNPAQLPSSVSHDDMNKVKTARVSAQQEGALRGLALSTQSRTGAVDAGANLRDLQVAASTATTLVPIGRVAMQANVMMVQELLTIRNLLAAMVEVQSAQALQNTPTLFTGRSVADPANP